MIETPSTHQDTAIPTSTENDPLALLECLHSHKNIRRDDVKAYADMTLQEIEDAIPGSAEGESGKQAAARELFIAVAQALSTTGWNHDKLALGVFPFNSEITQYIRGTPSLTSVAYENAKYEELAKTHNLVRSWGNPSATEAEFSITIGGTTQVVLFQFIESKLIISDGLCYDQSKQIKALAAAIRKTNESCDTLQSDIELVTSYLRQTRALDHFAAVLTNYDEEEWNRTQDWQESTRETVNSIFTYVSADVDALGGCEVVGQIDINGTNRQIIFRNSGDEMDIAWTGNAQKSNVAALAQVIRNKVNAVGVMPDIDRLRSFLEEEQVMERVNSIARKRYRALFEASDEVLKLEDDNGDALPMYRLLRVGQAYQIQKSSLPGYKTQWHLALNVTAAFAAKATEEVAWPDDDHKLLSRAVEEANRPKNSLACPQCGAELVIRTASVLHLSGRPFWGCSTLPKCRFTHLIETQ